MTTSPIWELPAKPIITYALSRSLSPGPLAWIDSDWVLAFKLTPPVAMRSA